MRMVIGFRASSIMYSWLVSNEIKGTVLLPANICETVPAVYVKAGLKIKLCDIDKETYDISEEIIRKKLSAEIKVLHFNHTYGRKNVEQDTLICKIKNEYPNILIVEDRCLCEPDLSVPKTVADIVIYSTGNTKVVNIGKGGFAYIGEKWNYIEQNEPFSDKADAEFDKHIKECHSNIRPVDWKIMKAEWIKFDLGMSQDEYMDELNKELPRSIKHKKIINEIYSGLNGSLEDDYNIWRYQLLLKNAIECKKALFEKIQDEYDVTVASEAYDEYVAEGKKSRPIDELWKELDI